MSDHPPPAPPETPPADDALRLQPPTAQKAREWLAVLNAANINPDLVRDGLRWEMLVEPEQRARALLEVEAYEEDARTQERERVAPAAAPEELNLGGFAMGLALVACWYLTGASQDPWLSLGEAESPAIMAGQWWRTITALTLHADAPHMLGNALALWLFGGMLCQRLGPGGGAFATLLAGAAGNLAAAWIRTGNTASIGASTAVFAGVGLLGMTHLLQRLRAPGKATWRELGLPILAVAAIVAFLGSGPSQDPAITPDVVKNPPTSGGTTDLLAHASGAVCGLLLGLASPWLSQRRTAAAWQVSLALAAVAAITLAWFFAWHHR